MSTTVTRSTCCYCGVGCGVLIDSEGGRITGVRGDPDHPANFGRLCTKGLNLAASAGSLSGRQLHPEWRTRRDSPRQRTDWDTALDYTAGRFADIIRTHGPDAVAFYVSGQLLTEDYYVFNKLAKGLIGTNNIDTNSRLCMSSAVTAYKLALGADGPPACYEDAELADCVLFAGSNAAYAHPVLFRRLEAARAQRQQKWIVIDPRRTDTAAMADLHLQIQPGTDVALLHAMLHHMIWEGWVDTAYIDRHTEGFAALKQTVRDYSPRTVAEICGVPAAQIMQAAEWFARSPASLSLYCQGLNQSSSGTDKNLALIHLHLATAQIGRPGAGPFSLTGQHNAMGGREVGGMATMLAAHRDIANPQHRAEVARQWGVPVAHLGSTPGLPAVQLFEALRAGKVKAIYIACTNPAHSLPDLPAVREALRQAELVVVQDCFAHTDTMAYADVVLPATTWGEKPGTVTNSERRISRMRAAVPPPAQARHDWQIATSFGQRLQQRLQPQWPPLFDFPDAESIFNEHRALTAGRDLDITGISYALLEQAGPQQWPWPAGAAAGQARRYTDGVFASVNGKAQFQRIEYQPVAEPVNARYPFHLLSGRLRDQWHGMSRTGRVARLLQHAPEPRLYIHPRDAGLRHLEEGTLVRVHSRQGNALVLPLAWSEELAPGTLFVPMHWNGQVLSSSGANEAFAAATCPKSRQPELKHAAVRIEPLTLPWRCVLACRSDDALALQARLQPLLAQIDYASLQLASDNVVVLRAAATEARPAWLAQLMELAALPEGEDALEHRDDRRGLYRRAGWRHGRLEGFVLAGADVQSATALLDELLAGAPWQGPRLRVFSVKASAPVDRIICNCKEIRQSQIEAQWLLNPDLPSLQERLGCGTVCGSCRPEILRVCQAVKLPEHGPA